MADILDSIVVRFGEETSDGSSGIFSKVELDPERNGNDENGNPKTTFNPGDPIFIRVQLQPGYVIDYITKTSGDVLNHGLKSMSETEEKTFFPDTEDMSLKWYPSTTPSASNFKGNTSSLTNIQEKSVAIASPPVICDVKYTFQGYSLEIREPSGMVVTEDDPWPTGVVIWIKEA